MYDFSAQVVHNLHLKGSARATAHPGAAVIVLLGVEHILAHAVEHPVLVAGLPASKGLQQLHLLLDQELVNHCQILQT